MLKMITLKSVQRALIHSPAAEINDEITSEINNKKAIDMMRPNENNRVFKYVNIPDLPGTVFTSQMILSDFCNCTKTPVAPSKMVAIPKIVAHIESLFRIATM